MTTPDGFQSVLQVYYNSHFLRKLRRWDGFHCPCELVVPLVLTWMFDRNQSKRQSPYKLPNLIPSLLHFEHCLRRPLHKSLILFALTLKTGLISRVYHK